MAQDRLFNESEIPDASDLHVAVIWARFNRDITERLLDGALSALKTSGAAAVKVYQVPGCFELPLVARKLAETGDFDAVVALGAVIRGETPHFDYVAGEAAAGLARASYDTGIPVAFGVLTTNNRDQAQDRAGGRSGNKGADAALTAVETALTIKSLR